MKQTNSLIDLKSFTIEPLIKRKLEIKKEKHKFLLCQSYNTSVSNFKTGEKNSDSSKSDNKKIILNKFNSNSFRKNNRSHIQIKNFDEEKCKSDCKNLEIIRNLEFIIKELLNANESLKKINDFLLLSIKKNEEIYLKIKKGNLNMKGDVLGLNYSNFVQNSKKLNVPNDTTTEQVISNSSKFEFKQVKNEAISKIIKNLKDNSNKNLMKNDLKINNYNDKRIDNNLNKEFKKPHKTIKMLPDKFSLNKNQQYENNETSNEKFHNNLNKKAKSEFFISEREKSLEHYDRLSEMSSLFSHRRNNRQQNVKSIISDEELDRNMFRDYNKLERILFDDEFIKEIKSSDEKLFSMLDSFSKINKDFNYSIQAIKKLKSLLKSSIILLNSSCQSEEEASKNLIKVACEMLECERSTIFIFDTSQNQLVQYIGNGLKRNQLKVEKNKGIVAACFDSGERIVVNNAYADKRFCIEFDKITGYVTKTVLCCPIKDSSGAIIGVLQSLNKITGIFTSDDEEIQEILSAYGSCILNKIQSNNMNQSQYSVSILKKIINFILELEQIRNKIDLTDQLENLMMDIFHTDKVRFYIHEKEENLIVREIRDRTEYKDIIGIIKHVIENRKLYLCKSLQDPYYNDLVDIHTSHFILTFPICRVDSSVYAVIQMGYENVNVFTLNLCDMDMYIINVINSIVSEWIETHNCVKL